MTDFDGILSEIREDPDAAAIRPDARTALSKLINRPHIDVAIVSGRALSDVRNRVGLDDIWYVGNHGLAIDIGERQFVHPDTEETTDLLQHACARLRDQLADIEGRCVTLYGRLSTERFTQPRLLLDHLHRSPRNHASLSGRSRAFPGADCLRAQQST